MTTHKKKATTENEQVFAVLSPITPRQQVLVEELLAGSNITVSARVAGVSRRAALYWLHDKKHPVRIEYEKQRSLMLSTFRQRVVALHEAAFKALEDLLLPTSPPHVRFATAKMIYESQLQGETQVVWPGEPDILLESELRGMFDPCAPGKSNVIYLYDDQNQERIPDD